MDINDILENLNIIDKTPYSILGDIESEDHSHRIEIFYPEDSDHTYIELFDKSLNHIKTIYNLEELNF